ncbi:MAG: proline--tRNA ligase [Pirellulaceae bacterium]|nr:proline--tRNA ligase [Pirellulaceae bacterium]
MAKNAISPTREENYPEWYQQVVKGANLAENSVVRGCMVIKPWGYAVWEKMQGALDSRFKETGHENAYFPLFIPMSYLEKEAQHVEGFAKECAVVTHHRLEPNGAGGLAPAGPLEEPLIVRPTSETIIGETFAKWVQSYRDLPIKINQWSNVVRWEMRTRLFLRTSEFLWQEGHTVHATEQEAQEETRLIHDLYAEFAEDYMAMPVLKGYKTADERFPGAVATYTIEAMMQDKKALQAGTSHFLGQNFSKAQEIKFQNEEGHEVYGWTTSWGVSTRLVGALVMTHADDDGLVLPPRLAPKQVVILPIVRKEEDRESILEYCDSLEKELSQQEAFGEKLRVKVDTREARGGGKKWQYIKQGVPILLEVGPRDVAAGKVFAYRRDTGEKWGVEKGAFTTEAGTFLETFQKGLFDKAAQFRRENTHEIDSVEALTTLFDDKGKEGSAPGGFANCYFCESPETLEILKPLKLTVRCVPDDQDHPVGKCIFTGKETTLKAVIAKAY